MNDQPLEPTNKERYIVDVSEPGRMGPNSTSKPIIVGHHPSMPDPMVNQRPIHHEPPLGPQPVPPAAQPPEAQPPSPPPADILTPPKSQPKTQAAGHPSIIEGEPLQSPPFDAQINDVSPPPTHHQSPGHTDTGLLAGRHHPSTDLDDSRPLKLPAGHGAKARFGWQWIVSFIIVFLFGLYLLLDAQIIKNNLSLPLHIFKQETPPV